MDIDENTVCQWFYEFLSCDSESVMADAVKEFVRKKVENSVSECKI